MKVQPISSLFLRTILVLPFLAGTGFACSCPPAPFCALYSQSPIIFVGRVVDVTQLPRRVNQTVDQGLVTFSVEEDLRGIKDKTVYVLHEPNTSCSIDFRRNERWLINGKPAFV